MLGLIALLYIFYLSIKLNIALYKRKQEIEGFGVARYRIILSHSSALTFPLATVVMILLKSSTLLAILVPIIIVIPSIYGSSTIAKQLESIGLADPKEAAKIPQNIYWLGVGTALFTTGNVVLGELLSGF